MKLILIGNINICLNEYLWYRVKKYIRVTVSAVYSHRETFNKLYRRNPTQRHFSERFERSEIHVGRNAPVPTPDHPHHTAEP